jgi:signal transduction histidine kinase
MGKLFWKFFGFLFLAQVATLAGTSFYFWTLRKKEFAENAGIEITRPARDVILMAAKTLEFSGEPALIALLKNFQTQHMPQVYVVGQDKKEILGRSFSSEQLAAAEKLANHAQKSQFAKKINLANGQTYLFFVPDLGIRMPMHLVPPPALGMGHEAPPPQGPPMQGGMDAPPPPPHQDPQFLLGPMLAGSVVSLIFAFLIAWYFSKPIKYLREAFAQAAQGNLATRIGNAVENRRDELADLARHFDTMAARLESLMQGQRRLMHHVSHELRSPLARMQIAIGLAKQTPQKMESSLERIQVESERMNGLIGELLWLSKLESGAMTIKKEEVLLGQIINNIVDDATFEAQERQIIITQKIAPNITLKGDANLLYSAIENVVRNAVKYSFEHGVVLVNLDKNSAQNGAVLTVTDEGSGVPETELEAIFQPFMRSSNSKAKDGYGVGLAIAKQIVEAHGGKLTAKNLMPHGFEMRFDLPMES